MVELTARQHEIYRWIVERQAQTGRLPTLREMSVAFDLTSPTSGVKGHLKALVKKGWMTCEFNTARAYTPVRGREYWEIFTASLSRGELSDLKEAIGC